MESRDARPESRPHGRPEQTESRDDQHGPGTPELLAAPPGSTPNHWRKAYSRSAASSATGLPKRCAVIETACSCKNGRSSRRPASVTSSA